MFEQSSGFFRKLQTLGTAIDARLPAAEPSASTPTPGSPDARGSQLRRDRAVRFREWGTICHIGRNMNHKQKRPPVPRPAKSETGGAQRRPAARVYTALLRRSTRRGLRFAIYATRGKTPSGTTEKHVLSGFALFRPAFPGGARNAGAPGRNAFCAFTVALCDSAARIGIQL